MLRLSELHPVMLFMLRPAEGEEGTESTQMQGFTDALGEAAK